MGGPWGVLPRWWRDAAAGWLLEFSVVVTPFWVCILSVLKDIFLRYFHTTVCTGSHSSQEARFPSLGSLWTPNYQGVWRVFLVCSTCEDAFWHFPQAVGPRFWLLWPCSSDRHQFGSVCDGLDRVWLTLAPLWVSLGGFGWVWKHFGVSLDRFGASLSGRQVAILHL